MPRKLRVEYPGAIYHVMSRGNQRQNIFRDDQDRFRFLQTLGEACAKTGWQVHAYCLMRNHFHLVVETPRGELVAGMKFLLGIYTKRFNIRHKTSGHLFAGRYKALPVDGSGNGYLQTVCDYVHLNPVRAKLLKKGELIEHFAWSSYPLYLQEPKQRPPWLRVDRLLGQKGIPKDSAAGWKQFSLRTQQRALEPGDEEAARALKGWYVGSDQFKAELLAAMEEKAGPNQYGAERQEVGESRARRLLGEALKAAGLRARELQDMPKGDPRKVEIAAQLRQQTTMTLQWIANALRMGSWSYLHNLLAGRQKTINLKRGNNKERNKNKK
ncbi:MAG: transposase [Verrucomicrobiales bacterium]